MELLKACWAVAVHQHALFINEINIFLLQQF